VGRDNWTLTEPAMETWVQVRSLSLNTMNKEVLFLKILRDLSPIHSAYDDDELLNINLI
jgi:hypothetical protein